MSKGKSIIARIIKGCVIAAMLIGIFQISIVSYASNKVVKPDKQTVSLQFYITKKAGTRNSGTVAVKVRDKIRKVVIPEKVKIKDRFYKVTEIKGTALKHDSIVMGDDAIIDRDEKEFFTNNRVQQIQIPRTVVKIEEGAFNRFPNLKKILVNKNNKIFKSTGVALLSKNGKILYQVCGSSKNYRVPKGVTKIANRAFAYTNVEKVVLPKTCTLIGDRAFFKCKKLEKINLSNVKRTGLYVFYKTKLSTI